MICACYLWVSSSSSGTRLKNAAMQSSECDTASMRSAPAARLLPALASTMSSTKAPLAHDRVTSEITAKELMRGCVKRNRCVTAII